MLRRTSVMVLLSLLHPIDGAAQDCFSPAQTVDSVKTHLLDLQARGRNSIWSFVERMVAPGPACPVLKEGIDRQAAIDELIRYVAELPVEYDPLKGAFFPWMSSALERQLEGPRPAIRIIDDPWHPTEEYHTYRPERLSPPIDALIYAVEGGRTARGRAAALRALFAFEENGRAFGYLVRWARARRGPPGYPDLPERIVGSLITYEGMPVRESPVRSALQANPALIQNPRARCVMERGPIPVPPIPPELRCPAG